MIFLLALTIYAAPDPTITPGKIDVNVTTTSLCTPGYTATIRNVSQKTKREVFRRYGLEQDGAKFEVDHWISLEIGGLNDIENLWPQNWPDARRKDVVETFLHRQMCKGKITLKEAQEQILVWPDVYERIKHK